MRPAWRRPGGDSGPGAAARTNRESCVHVWQVALPDGPDDGADIAAAPVLSRDEVLRADRLRCGKTRRTFVATRCALRMILARYLTVPPRAISFRYNAHGKPAVAGGATAPAFNVSHSGARALIAVATAPVGIDVERIDPALDWRPLAEVALDPAEAAALATLPEDRARHAFLTCWTAKEACAKGRGLGLSVAPRDLRICWEAPPRCRVMTAAAEARADDWFLYAAPVAGPYVATLAIQTARITMVPFRFRWPVQETSETAPAVGRRAPDRCRPLSTRTTKPRWDMHDGFLDADAFGLP